MFLSFVLSNIISKIALFPIQSNKKRQSHLCNRFYGRLLVCPPPPLNEPLGLDLLVDGDRGWG